MTATALKQTILTGIVTQDGSHLADQWHQAYYTWLSSIFARSKSTNTLTAYQTACRQFFEWSQAQPWDVTPALAQQWAASMVKLSGKSVNQKVSALTGFYQHVIKTTDLWPTEKRNPFTSVTREKIKPYGQSVWPSEQEARAMLDACNRKTITGKRDYALLLTFLTTTRRSSEILNLTWGDLEPSANAPGDYIFKYRAKGGETRRAVLDSACYSAICDYLDFAGRLEVMSKGDFIFAPIRDVAHLRNVGRNMNRPLRNCTANKLLKKYARRAGVEAEKAHIHGLRHAGLRLHLRLMKTSGLGIDYEEIMRLAGHANLSITQIYIQQVGTDPEVSTSKAAANHLTRSTRKNGKQSQDELAQLRRQLAQMTQLLAQLGG